MKILIILNDSTRVINTYINTGIYNEPHRRAVEIKLTEDQVKKIGKRKIGIDKGIDVYETIESVSILKTE